MIQLKGKISTELSKVAYSTSLNTMHNFYCTSEVAKKLTYLGPYYCSTVQYKVKEADRHYTEFP